MEKISRISEWIGARVMGSADGVVEHLLTDSRSLCFPETTLFIAIRTAKGDGHRYVADLIARGVRMFVVEQLPPQPDPSATYLLVDNSLQALQCLAMRHRERYRIPVIAITGSNGKTTVKEWLYQMLSPDYVVTRSPRSYNSQIGVPLSVWGLSGRSQIGIFEAGISQPGEMEALAAIIKPTIGIFTGLGDAHQEFFSSMEEKRREKWRLFEGCQRVFSIGEGKDPLLEGKKLCAEVCRYFGMDEDVIASRLQNLESVAMRLEVKQGRHDCVLINDSYNNDLSSLDTALDFMMRRPERRDRQRVLILSDICQTGLSNEQFIRHVRALLQSRGIDIFIGIGSVLSQSGLGYGFANTESFLRSDLFQRLRGALILIKGARHFRFEVITSALEQKVHETVLEVNLAAVVENLNHYRSFLLHGASRETHATPFVCMVKADAYGAGAVEVSKTLQDQGVSYLAVAVADEGAQLRAAGITTGIMVMNPEMSSFDTLFEYNLEPEVYSFRLLDALVRAAEKSGVTDFPVHIKLDTGMHRLGFDPEKDMPELLSHLHRQSAVVPRSVFSHFVGSDSDNFDAFSREQYRRFTVGANALQEGFTHHILRHICNSAGIVHFPEYQHDLCRLGLGLYGIDSRTNAMLSNVSTLKTTILQIHDIPASETVGYSRKGRLTRDSRIAVLPIGYADGLNRLLGGGRGYCLVNGNKAPYVGNICMDVSMIDVTDVPCQEGDTAVIFGEALSPSVLAELIGTIPYEILTSVSSRVKRVYFQ